MLGSQFLQVDFDRLRSKLEAFGESTDELMSVTEEGLFEHGEYLRKVWEGEGAEDILRKEDRLYEAIVSEISGLYEVTSDMEKTGKSIYQREKAGSELARIRTYY